MRVAEELEEPVRIDAVDPDAARLFASVANGPWRVLALVRLGASAEWAQGFARAGSALLGAAVTACSSLDALSRWKRFAAPGERAVLTIDGDDAGQLVAALREVDAAVACVREGATRLDTLERLSLLGRSKLPGCFAEADA